MDIEQQIASYMTKPYSIRLRQLADDEGGGWLAEVVELLGCMSDGESPEDALRNLTEAKEEWLATAIERGMPIPEPRKAVRTRLKPSAISESPRPKYHGRIARD